MNSDITSEFLHGIGCWMLEMYAKDSFRYWFVLDFNSDDDIMNL